jgi:hypothetical protein
MKTLAIKIPLHGNEYKVFDELTSKTIAIFFFKKDAIDYINFKAQNKVSDYKKNTKLYTVLPHKY